MKNRIKRAIAVFSLLIATATAIAQKENISMALAIPADCQLDSSLKSLLKSKIQRLTTLDGVDASEFGALAIIPEVTVLNTQHVDGGMRRITSIELDLALSVTNILTNTVFNSMQTTLKGEGYSENEALRSAINKIDVSSPQFALFVEASKTKIINYYDQNTKTLILKAYNLANQQLYDEALALLTTYPESLSGYPEVSAAISDIFSKCQNSICSQILIMAEVAYSRHDYEEASSLISTIDASSQCASKAKELLAKIDDALKKQQAETLSLERERRRSQAEVHLAEVNAAKEVAKAYYKRQVQYIFI